MITVLHGGICPNDYNVTKGGGEGSLGTPKNDYVICAQHLISAIWEKGTPSRESGF